MSGRAWSHAETGQLRELADTGTPDAEIAATLNAMFRNDRTTVAVFMFRKRHGIATTARPGQPPNAHQRSVILTHLGDGRTLSWIAGRLGISHHALSQTVRRLMADGLVKRTGNATRNVRYVPTLKWTRDFHGTD